MNSTTPEEKQRLRAVGYPPYSYADYLDRRACKALWKKAVGKGWTEATLKNRFEKLGPVLRAAKDRFPPGNVGRLSMEDFGEALRANACQPVVAAFAHIQNDTHKRNIFTLVLDMVDLRASQYQGTWRVYETYDDEEEDADPDPAEDLVEKYGRLPTGLVAQKLKVPCVRTLFRFVRVTKDNAETTGNKRFGKMSGLLEVALAAAPGSYREGLYGKARLRELLRANNHAVLRAVVEASNTNDNSGHKKKGLDYLFEWLGCAADFRERTMDLIRQARVLVLPVAPTENCTVGQLLTEGTVDDFWAFLVASIPQNYVRMSMVYSVAVPLRSALEAAGRIQNRVLQGPKLTKALLRQLLRDPNDITATLQGTRANFRGPKRVHMPSAWRVFLAWLDEEVPAALPANDDEDDEEEDEEVMEQGAGAEMRLVEEVVAEQQLEDAAAEAAAGVEAPRPVGWIDAAGSWHTITNDPSIDGARLPTDAVDEHRRQRFPSHYSPAMIRDLLQNGGNHWKLLMSKLRTLHRFNDIDIPRLQDGEEKQQLTVLVRGHLDQCRRQIMFGGRMLNEERWRNRNTSNVNTAPTSTPAKTGTPAGRQYEVQAKEKLRAGIHAAGLAAEMQVGPVLENARPDMQILVDVPEQAHATTLFVQVKGIGNGAAIPLTREDTLPRTWYEGYLMLLVGRNGEIWATTWATLVRTLTNDEPGEDLPGRVLVNGTITAALAQWRVPDEVAPGNGGGVPVSGMARLAQELRDLGELLGSQAHPDPGAAFTLNGQHYPVNEVTNFTGQPLPLHGSGVSENLARRYTRHALLAGAGAAVELTAEDGQARVGLDVRLVGEGERDGAVYDAALCVRRIPGQADGQAAHMEEVGPASDIDMVQCKRFYPPYGNHAGHGGCCWHHVNGQVAPYSSKDPIDIFHYAAGNMAYTQTPAAFFPASLMRILGFLDKHLATLVYPSMPSVHERMSPTYPHRYAWVQSRFMRTPQQMQGADMGTWYERMRAVWVVPYKQEPAQ